MNSLISNQFSPNTTFQYRNSSINNRLYSQLLMQEKVFFIFHNFIKQKNMLRYNSKAFELLTYKSKLWFHPNVKVSFVWHFELKKKKKPRNRNSIHFKEENIFKSSDENWEIDIDAFIWTQKTEMLQMNIQCIVVIYNHMWWWLRVIHC